MPIFLEETDYRQFVHLLGVVVSSFRLTCWNYCVMPNHYHLTIQPTQPNLSDAIRRLNSEYGQWWNRRHKRVGHVFQGRFKDQIVDRESYLLALSRYVVLNPVRASLVKRPEDWPWSSYRATVGFSSAPAFLSTDLTLGLFGNAGVPLLRARFIAMIGAGVHDATLADRIRSNDRILGDRAFEEAVRSSTDSD